MGIKVLVVDDSISARTLIETILLTSDAIDEVITAEDAYRARDLVVSEKPDVICLDVEMPKMDGITFLRKLMRYMPTPVIMVSAFTTRGAKVTLDALEAGAVDFVSKPENLDRNFESINEELISKVISASQARLQKSDWRATAPRPLPPCRCIDPKAIIAIGSSTGGVEALKSILSRMPANSPGIVVVQHMPPPFIPQLVENLQRVSLLKIKAAEDGEEILPGTVLIAPGDSHMVVRSGTGGSYFVELGGGEKVSGHRPSVDILFNSISRSAAGHAVGVILTGMGNDGAKGLLNMRQSGAGTIGQDKESCVVYGMPKSAFEMGALEEQHPLDAIAQAIVRMVETKSGGTRG